MDGNESVKVYLQKLENLLDSDFSAEGGNLTEKLDSVGTGLPDELQVFLRDIAERAVRANQSEDFADLFFRFGQAAEQLRALRQNRAAESVASLRTDGLSPAQLEKTELDAIARFLAARDRVMRTVADFTLKALLILIGLLILGLLFGVV